MNCKHVQDLVLTDYSDGQMPPERARRVEGHLAHCASCRALAQKVRQDLAGPLEGARAPGPDAFVWLRIKEKIRQEAAIEDPGISVADMVRNFVQPFRPVAVMACLFVMLGVGLVIRQNLSHQQPYMAYMMGAEAQGDDVSAGIEQYFL